MDLHIETVPIDTLVPYEGNAKLHPKKQIEQIAHSIQEFGNCDPIGVWTHPQTGTTVIVEGHGRYQALLSLGHTEIPIIRLDHLTDEQRRAYTIAHNQLTLNSGWDIKLLDIEIEQLTEEGYELHDLGFKELPSAENAAEIVSAQNTEEYKEFIEKFEPKRTTDDCFTPVRVYETVKEWVFARYNLEPDTPIIRPFYPGGDYQNETYPDGCVVIDNPPFSITAEIVAFYQEIGQPFFLFTPGLMLNIKPGTTRVCVYPQIEYDNGAKVPTGFITNMSPELLAETAPELSQALNDVQKKDTKPMSNEYPINVLTASKLNYYARYGQHLAIPASQAKLINKIDATAIYGKALLVTELIEAEVVNAEKGAHDAKIQITKSKIRELKTSITD